MAGMRKPDRTGRLATLPNALSFVRLALAPAFALAPGDASRGGVLLAAAATEWLDGRLARRWGQTSRAGELLDPVADRVFVLTALGTFLALGRLELWQLALLLLRDLFTAAGYLAVLLLRLPLHLRSRRPGKWATALQLAALVLLLVRPAWFAWFLPLVVAVSAWAVIDYARAGVAGLREAGWR